MRGTARRLARKGRAESERRSGRMTAAHWDELIDRHLSRQAVERGLSRHSMEAYAHDLSLFQSWCRDSGLEPAQLDAAALTAYLEALADQGFAVSSQRRHLASLRGLARELVDEKILERDPAPAVKLRPHPRKLPRTLSPADIENLIAAIDAHDARGSARSRDARDGLRMRAARFGAGRLAIASGESRGRRRSLCSARAARNGWCRWAAPRFAR